MFDTVVFDLDGTLLDTSQGIFNSVRYAEEKMGLRPLSADQLPLFVGPPPTSMYEKLHGLSHEDAIRATTFHREYSRTKAVNEAQVYPWIPNLLDKLREHSKKIAVATLKTQSIAECVLDRCGLRRRFDAIVGMNDSESMTKADIVSLAVQITCGKNAVLVGDTEYDLVGAQEAGVAFIGVGYGFGYHGGEILQYGKLASSTEELQIYLLAP